jgi:hypothetical protein
MAKPETTMILVSNVFSRMMHFKNVCDVEHGHKHHYDHATLLSSGKVLYEVIDPSTNLVTASKEFVAPAFIFVAKDKTHRLTALEANTVCSCIHALRSETGELLDPDFLIEEVCRDNEPLHYPLKSNRDSSLSVKLQPMLVI